MAQPSIASFFNTRKRAAPTEEVVAAIKSKRLNEPIVKTSKDITFATTDSQDDIASLKAATNDLRTRSGRTIKRTGAKALEDKKEAISKKISKKESAVTMQQQKLVQFIQKGRLSPKKKSTREATVVTETESTITQIPPVTTPKKNIQQVNEETPSTSGTITNNALISKTDNNEFMEQCMKTPTKQIMKGTTPLKHGELKSLVKKELNFDEVKNKISRSEKLQELKASLARLQELEKTRKLQAEHNRRLREGIPMSPKSSTKTSAVVQLKQFDTIELEVLTSPAKNFKTPTKLPPPTPDKNELMSPRHTDLSKRVLFSPAKHGSPAKIIAPPAYQRFMNLVETSKAGDLPLPYKYRHLIEIFRAVESVCAMFYNRKECITFKKLKPAVQRMLRKNFYESHLAQIKQLLPDAYIFTQMKMRNFGSASKADYFQLVITPNVEDKQLQQQLHKIDEENVLQAAQSNAMNPPLMTERLQHFQQLLLQRVKQEHDKFLRSLNPPIIVPMHKVTRWHPDFDLENCPEIEQAHLPQPPNVEKYSSARDILSTARNLFNCATPMERIMERYEARMENIQNSKAEAKTNANTEVLNKIESADLKATTSGNVNADANADVNSTLLKGVPKSLLEKIRAKQAAKALDAMTRRPSQDEEAAKYSRLPDLARHLRNVFITERKGVLTLELIIKKIQNSYRTSLNASEVESHLKLMAKEVPEWLSFHEVRKTIYLKIVKNMDLGKILQRLEQLANEKSKL